MSSGLSYAGNVYWGTNGAVELCLETMLEIASEQLGSSARLAVFLRDWRDGWHMGAVVGLDEILDDQRVREQFAAILAIAMQRMTAAHGGMTDHGRAWVADVLRELHSLIA